MSVIRFEVLEEARIAYELVTYQGKIKVNGESIEYRYSEDNNGAEFFVYNEDNWEEVDYDSNENWSALFHAIQAWGNPKEFGEDGEKFEEDSSNFI